MGSFGQISREFHGAFELASELQMFFDDFYHFQRVQIVAESIRREEDNVVCLDLVSAFETELGVI